MTRIAAQRRTGTIDMRCSAEYVHAGERTRCQLLAGHHGEHAVMYGGRDRRLVLLWHGAATATPAGDDWMRLPWMRGYPSPAWFESTD